MRFAFCLYRYFPYSGLSRDFLRILTEAQSRGHEVQVYAYDWQGKRPEHVAVQRLAARALTNHGRNTHFYRQLQKILDGEYFDAIIGFNKMPGLDLYYGADYCYIARAKPKYSPLYRLTPRYAQQTRFERAVFEASGRTAILSLSEREKGVYQQYYGTPEQRFVMLPPTLDIQRKPEGDLDAKRSAKREELGLSTADNLILFIGSGFRTKGLGRAIHAFAALPETLQEASRMYVVGQDDDRPYHKLTTQLGISTHVEFLGGRSDVPDLMLAGDALLHPAISENTGTVILEAIASGLPVIATDACGYAPHIRQANTGYILPSPFSQAELNTCLHRILTAIDHASWRANGRAYGQNPALYRMPETAVNAIEEWVAQRHSPANELHTTTTQPAYLPQSVRGAFPQTYSVEDIIKTSGILIREQRNQRILQIQHDQHAYHLNTYASTAWHTLLASLARLDLPEAGAQREWHAAHHLIRLGIPTATPIAWGSQARSLTRRYSFIITEAMDAIPLAQYLRQADISFQQKRALVRRIADIVQTIHASGASHGQLDFSSFLLNQASSQEANLQLYVTHLSEFQPSSRRLPKKIIADLVSLYHAYRATPASMVSRNMILRFMCQYHQCTLREWAQEHHDFWQAIAHTAQPASVSTPAPFKLAPYPAPTLTP